MRFVAETKVLSAAWAQTHLPVVEAAFARFLQEISKSTFTHKCKSIDLAAYHEAFPNRDFFVEFDLRLLLGAKNLAMHIGEDSIHLRNLLLLACAANTVASSNMTRRADLRRRRPDQYQNRVVNVPELVSASLGQMLSDIRELPETMATMRLASENARRLPEEYDDSFDIAVTSPPYLNGTNYFRNTKLELWLLDMISSEGDLQRLAYRPCVLA